MGTLTRCGHHNERIAQCAYGLQTVEPRFQFGEALLYLCQVGVALALSTHKSIVDEVERPCRDYGEEERKGGAKGDE